MQSQSSESEWPMFDCLFCHSVMRVVNQRAIQHAAISTSYQCDACNYCLAIKVPRTLAETLVPPDYLPAPVKE